MAIVEAIGTQGLVTLTTPVEVIYLDDEIKFGLKDRNFSLKVPKRFIRGSRDVMVLKDFLESVYKAGFSDGAIKALLNPSQPAGNYLFREASCAGQTQNICATMPGSVCCLPTEFKSED